MSQILLITSSPRATASYSTQVAHALAKNLISRRKDSTLIVRPDRTIVRARKRLFAAVSSSMTALLADGEVQHLHPFAP